MEDKINIAELLKDCPKGMELDCTMFEGCTLSKVYSNERDTSFPIRIKTENGLEIALTEYGQYYTSKDAKCVIFPKGKTTWEGFKRPFKDGDIIAYREFIAIFHKFESRHLYYHCWIHKTTNNAMFKDGYGIGFIDDYVYATEEEKQKLFQAIKDNGYQWNAETKKLEKLVPDKFDITTLKPYDRVLVRFSSRDIWRINLLERYDKTSDNPFLCIGYERFKQCIPYEGNEHLLGTIKDCPEYYKING